MPDGFALELPTPRAFLPLLEPARYKGAYGGRGSGKSHFFAECVVEQMATNPAVSVVCIREIQKSLELSAKKLIEAKIRQHGLGRLFDVQKTIIKRRGGTGVCIFQGMQDHTAESIKSLEGFNIAWVEEAQSLSKRSLDLLRPTIRAEGSEIWFSWNPRRRNDPIEQLLRSRSGPRLNAIVEKVNYTDNPFLPDVLLREAQDDKRDSPDTYPHKWLGAYEELGSKTVIPALWVEAAIGLAEKLGLDVTGRTYSALDVAGAEDGGDENAQAVRKGIELRHIEKWNGLDTSLTTQRAVRLAAEHKATDNFYDSAGVGEGVTGEWGSMGRRGERPSGMRFTPWNGGASVVDPDKPTSPGNSQSPLNKDQYMNLKAQAWFRLRARFENAFKAANGRPYDADNLISIRLNLPYIGQLADELSQPQQRIGGAGKIIVDKQPDNSRSPNLADSVVMAFCPVGSTYSLANVA